MADQNQDETIAALLEERSRARDDDHRAAIDYELSQRGYKVAAEKRAAVADGDRSAVPEGRTSARGKQTAG